MFSLIKFAFSFVFSFLILSIPINDQSLFTHIHEASAPFTEEFIGVLSKNTTKAINETTEIGRRAFSNTKPKENQSDKVKATQSSTRRSPSVNHEDYTVEEKELLKRVFEKAH